MAALRSASSGGWRASTGLLFRLWITAHSLVAAPWPAWVLTSCCSTAFSAALARGQWWGKAPVPEPGAPLQPLPFAPFSRLLPGTDSNWSCFLPMYSGAVGQEQRARREEPQGIVYQWEQAGKQGWAGSSSAKLTGAGSTCSHPVPGCVRITAAGSCDREEARADVRPRDAPGLGFGTCPRLLCQGHPRTPHCARQTHIQGGRLPAACSPTGTSRAVPSARLCPETLQPSAGTVPALSATQVQEQHGQG